MRQRSSRFGRLDSCRGGASDRRWVTDFRPRTFVCLLFMRLVTFQQPHGQPQVGIVSGSQVLPVLGDMLSVCAAGHAEQEDAPPLELADVTLLAPIPRPPKFICVGLNYRDHAAEAKMEIPQVPTIFNKFTNVVIGPGATIVLPRVSSKPDYEAELAFVIGRGGRYIPAARAMEHVFGYTIVNDVSARDFQMATTQWLMGKTFDTFAPMGPWIVTKDEISDPHALDISIEIGGEILQKSNTREMIFRIPAVDRVHLAGGDAGAGRRGGDRDTGGRRIRVEAAALAAAGR